MEWIIGLIAGLLGGGGACYVLLTNINKKSQQKLIEQSNQKSDLILEQAKIAAKRITDEAEVNSEKLLSKAEVRNEQIKQKKIQEAKDHFNSKRSEFEKEKSSHVVEMKERELTVVSMENDFKRKQSDFKAKMDAIELKESELTAVRDNLEKQLKIVSKRKEELDASTEKQIKALENIAKLSESEAKEQLIDAIKAKAESDAMSYVKDAAEQAKVTASKEAKKIVIQSIQRMASEITIENTVSVFHLDNDDIKGQIIGREGRNIRALEAATGAEIVVDDTPEAIVISSFDPIRREICRLALQRLVADGRIHPARIEEVVAKVKKQLEEQIREIGERAVIELDIHGLDPYLIWMVGRMRFRSSYGQNLLKHSIETANLCATMCAELGLNTKLIKLAKRAGLLHDIGKVTEEESELSHAIIGMKLCEKYNEHPAIINAVGAHHDEIEMNSIISPITQACDAISGARPGARREILESYLKRIGELEDLAMSYDGVQKAYALQAGRELRVIVESDKVSDGFADELAFMISQRIEKEMQYPGQVRVTVIREKRATSIAR
ncbi:MAG: ribonuclease Y [Saprospiraceae bacterium]|jgi:ribonuclease Y|nr:ribonuclease Y [Saprospiraceae bacterium]MBK6481045.1 ribonuclease Y [Saprospiraceae bacterium]MBK6815552.1 ribonuclease Y [Saprospiraceae bacterium]MBK7439220.1 ribonuclease Y [Saprospiraceae bacterium]MBK7607859.1 ribonuclease Y [Saprospiraceae bacterium]